MPGADLAGVHEAELALGLQRLEDRHHLLDEGDTIVDGGNTNWHDDVRRAAELDARGIHYVDVGTSGGVWGLEVGYCMMVGGHEESVQRLAPILDVLAPPDGWRQFGDAGAGHFVKMVHNGIEYGIMQAYAEGYELLEAADVVENVPEAFESWREGTVIRSWLLDLLVASLKDDSHLAKIRGYADDSGEGRWTVEAAIDHAVPMPAISAALFARFASRQEDSPAMKAIAAMRNQFGGHAVKGAEAADPSYATPPKN